MKIIKYHLKKSFIIFFILIATTAFAQNKTNVLVLGTIHKYHSIDTNYSYYDIIKIIKSYKPDVICVEIRPKDFRKSDKYPKEMYLATIYGINNNIPVKPIDWWKEGVRNKRNELMKKEENIEKEKLEDSLDQADSLIQSFERKYGRYNELSKKNYGYLFWNGNEFNNYIAETYKISMSVFGDSPMNLFYETRNNKMIALINQTLKQFKNKNVLILTGVEHKHYFDKKLGSNKNIKLLQLQDIKLSEIDLARIDKETYNCLEYGLCLSYFNEGTIDKDAYYLGALRPLLHGAKMDFNPSTIPKSNIHKAIYLLKMWDPSNNYKIIKTFEDAWVKFINKDYNKSLQLFLFAEKNIELLKTNKNINVFFKKFYIISIYRNLGLIYYKMHDSKNGNKMFEKGEKLFKDFGMPDRVKNLLFNKQI